MSKFTLSTQIFTAAVERVASRAAAPGTNGAAIRILGQPFEERPLRLGLESSLRSLAHLTAGQERIRLIDQANRVRPRTLI